MLVTPEDSAGTHTHHASSAAVTRRYIWNQTCDSDFGCFSLSLSSLSESVHSISTCGEGNESH